MAQPVLTRSNMRRPRRLPPGAFWLVTSRVARGEFRLRPDAARRGIFGYWLARAHQRYPDVRIYAAMQMSNHLHLVVKDTKGRLWRFMEYFLGNLSKDINRQDKTRGQVFERRYVATEIIDHESLIDKIVYTLINPVKAGLVQRHTEWPGICLVARRTGHNTVRFGRTRFWAYARMKRRHPDLEWKKRDFRDTETLNLTPIPRITDKDLKKRIRDKERELAAKRTGRVMGLKKILKEDPFDRPQKPLPWGRIPLCHASTRKRWDAYLEKWRDFVRRFRRASAAFLSGKLRTAFPPHCFRPSLRVA